MWAARPPRPRINSVKNEMAFRSAPGGRLALINLFLVFFSSLYFEYDFRNKYTGWAKKTDHFLKCITFLYNGLGRQSIYQNVRLFIRSKNDILNAAVFKYSLHKVRETTLH